MTRYRHVTQPLGAVFGMAMVLALDLSNGTAVAQARAITPPGPIILVYRDEVSNVRQLKGTARYGGRVGRDPTVTFTVENERREEACTGTLTTESRFTGKFSLSCFGGYFSGNGSYERKRGDPITSFIARGVTPKGLPIMLVIGRPSGISENQYLVP